MIRRFPRYGELFDAWQTQKNSTSRSLFGPQEFRDLQMWSQLAWFDEEFREEDPEVREWMKRGRNFTLTDQASMGAKQRELVSLTMTEYRKMARLGQIEISTTPYYHPILPLICDSNIASVSHPGVNLPERFRYPDDARLQLVRARDFIADRFGAEPVGLWPSEGSVSDEVFAIAAELGFEWAATDSGVLSRTLPQAVTTDALYRPYRWSQGGRSIGVIFRDHYLSDLIGFVYQKMDAGAAADDFLRRIRDNAAAILRSGRDAFVPIILDGENCWEYYDRNGRPFLRELYRRISNDSGMQAVTAGEAVRTMAADPLDHIFPASWISANFDVWIGADEDNDAWTQLLRARQTYDAESSRVGEAQQKRAFESLLAAEGSDWCWWYGPEHFSDNRVEFDQLYRSHLANVYRCLNLAPPEELSRPILRTEAVTAEIPPSAPITAVIDGRVTSYFEWMGAGVYRMDDRSGAMHGGQSGLREIWYGCDAANLFVRIDLHSRPDQTAGALELRVRLEAAPGESSQLLARLGPDARVEGIAGAECVAREIVEVRVPLRAVAALAGSEIRFQISLWKDGLPVDAATRQGWFEMRAAATE